MAATRVSSLLVTASINIIVIAASFALYSIFRKRPSNANVYFARHVLREIDNRRQSRRKKKKNAEELDESSLDPPPFSIKNFIPSAGWVKKAWSYSEDEILNTCGLDGVVFLRMFLLCFRFFGLATIIGFCILLPTNYFQADTHITTIGSDSLNKFTISNVPNGSNRLWIHLSILYCVSFLAYGTLYMEYQYIANKRVKYLRSSRPQLDQYTVLVRSIPKCDHEGFNKQIDDFFVSHYPCTYLLKHIVYNDGEVEKMMHELQALTREIESLKLLPSSLRGQQKTGFLGLFGHKEDPLSLYTKHLQEIVQNIKKYQNKTVKIENELPVAFVSFKTRWGAAIAAQTRQSTNPLQWITEWAPEPRDVIWHNLLIAFPRLWMFRLVVRVTFFVIIIFFFIPAGLVYTLAKLENIMALFPFIKKVLQFPFISSLISGYLPSLLLSIIYYLIPPLMLSLTRWEGYPSYSMEERRACGKVFLFLIGNSFFLVTYGSLISLLDKAIESPKQIPALLAFTVPGQANFFMNLIMTQGWTGLAIEILLPDVLLLCLFRRHFTQKPLYGPCVQPLQYYRSLPTILLYIFIGLMYIIQAPLLLPFFMVYFIGGYIVYCNQLVNVYEPAYETGGQYWPDVHNRIVASIFVMQLVCIGVFGLKNKTSAATCCFPLLLATVIFNYYCERRFHPVFEYLPIEIIVPKDEEDEKEGLKDDLLESLQTAYACPPEQRIDRFLDGDSDYESLLSGSSHTSSSV